MVLVGIYLCLWFHTVACFLTFLVKLEKKWVPTLDFMFFGRKDWLNLFNEEKTNDRHFYLEMLYHSALTFSLVDISPRTVTEIFCCTFLMLISAMINAQIYGSFAVLQEVSGQSNTEF